MKAQREQIVALARACDRVKLEIDSHWAKAHKLLTNNHTNEAISLLNRYFSLRTELEQLEGSLVGILKGYFPDK
jgi:hypothetical protein